MDTELDNFRLKKLDLHFMHSGVDLSVISSHAKDLTHLSIREWFKKQFKKHNYPLGGGVAIISHFHLLLCFRLYKGKYPIFTKKSTQNVVIFKGRVSTLVQTKYWKLPFFKILFNPSHSDSKILPFHGKFNKDSFFPLLNNCKLMRVTYDRLGVSVDLEAFF